MARIRKTKHSSAERSEVSSGTTVIPEDEQWRLINDSGVLNKIRSARDDSGEEESASLPEEIFNAITIIIPASFLLLLMEILIHFQYGKHPTLHAVVDRMLPGIPILSIFIFYTTRYKSHPAMQVFLFALGVLSGGRLLYLLDRGSWFVNMQQCPPLATVWVYTIVQLNLLPAVSTAVEAPVLETRPERLLS
ncbi:hypothetical protein LshimejAT787_0106040 [Lyophyllum shimeji]|uniref:DUF7719 domain-containing protein n=1 Tax=Lyophyllum shimeji TaxID=47721 RepID=A0A9P3PD12_LYOSH|nr:hypothetical protein LshimejAT787_0106040 [Lyophyllum shimeji]